MKKAFTIFALIAAALAIIMAVLPISNLAIIPAIAAISFGVIAFYLSKKTAEPKKNYSVYIFVNICCLST